ncbi:MAG: hypothetical protein WDA53_06115, partial [Bacillota bacterium]
MLLGRGTVKLAQVLRDAGAIIDLDQDNVRAWAMKAIANQNLYHVQEALTDWNWVEKLEGPSY